MLQLGIVLHPGMTEEEKQEAGRRQMELLKPGAPATPSSGYASMMQRLMEQQIANTGGQTIDPCGKLYTGKQRCGDPSGIIKPVSVAYRPAQQVAVTPPKMSPWIVAGLASIATLAVVFVARRF